MRRALRPGAGRDRRGALPRRAPRRRPAAERPVHERRRALPRVPHAQRRSRPGARRLGAEGHGRRRLPDRQEVGDGPRPGRPHQIRHLQRGRGRAGHLQGPPDPGRAAAPGDRGDADRDAFDRRPAGVGLRPPRVRARGAGPARGDRARAGGRPARGRVDRRVHLAGRLHPRRGDRAAGVHGGPPRRAPQQAAVPGRLRPARPAHADEQRRDVRIGPDHPRARRRLVEGPGRQRRVGVEVLLGLGPRRATGCVLRARRHLRFRRDRRWPAGYGAAEPSAPCSPGAHRRTSSGPTA